MKDAREAGWVGTDGAFGDTELFYSGLGRWTPAESHLPHPDRMVISPQIRTVPAFVHVGFRAVIAQRGVSASVQISAVVPICGDQRSTGQDPLARDRLRLFFFIDNDNLQAIRRTTIDDVSQRPHRRVDAL